MSDSILLRNLAGASFRRGDSHRDERAADPVRPVEDFLRNLAGWWPPQRESTKSIQRLNAAVMREAQDLRDLNDAEVAAEFHRRVLLLKADSAMANDLQHLPAVLACTAEACRRRIGLWPHPVQFAGTRALLRGQLAEMQTGEGKTLVAALAATAMAGAGASVHVISTNDYLARRDCEEMSPIYGFFGLASGFIEGGMSADDRRHAYAQGICYASGKEVVFDYLKDRLCGNGALPLRVAQLRALAVDAQQPQPEPLIPALHFAIVDEADSVLIDEARTPMILSRESPPVFAPELLAWAMASAQRLQVGRHFRISAARDLDLLPEAVDLALPMPTEIRGMWQARPLREHMLRQALIALHLYHRDQHYILAEGKVQIVDESTGRVMPDRAWEQGLHQLIETKEQVALTAGRETLLRMTYQRFFRRYYLVAGLTGTAAEASRELWWVYRLRVCRIPPNRPNCRIVLVPRCLPTAQAKWVVVADEAVAAARRGQPVLVGTRSVQASEQIAAELTRRSVAHVVLNARQDAEEAQIVALAGASSRITVATNMAGRGTDIKPDAASRAAGGLHVILTEYHESPRVDRQLAGRSGRQGEPGTARAIVSIQDALFDGEARLIKRLLVQAPIATRLGLLQWLRSRAQQRAERRAYRTRLQTLQQDRELHRMIGFAGRVT